MCKIELKKINNVQKDMEEIKQCLKRIDKLYYHNRIIQNRKSASNIFQYNRNDDNFFPYVNLFSKE